MRSNGVDRRWRWSWLTLIGLLACGGANESEESADPIAPGAEAPVDGDLAEVAGDEALATVFFQPHRWPEVRDAIRGALAAPLPEEVRHYLSLPLEEALRAAHARRMADALSELRGVDTERPMVLRFAETNDDGLAWVTELAANDFRLSDNPSGIRHVLAVPASDPVALERSLGRALDHLCRPENGERRCPGGWGVRIEAESRWVWAIFGELDAPLRGSGEASGTLRWAMDPRWPAAAYFRHSAMRSTAVHVGVRQMRQALAYASADYLNQLATAGLAEVIAAHSRTAPYGTEVDEGALALRAEPASLLFVGHLTPRATDALAAADAEPSGVPSPRTEHQHLEVRSALPLRGAVRQVVPPFAIPRDDPRRALRAVSRCGPYCLFGTLSQPLASARLATDLHAMEAIAEHVRYVPDSSLGQGGLQAHLDIAGIARVEGSRDLQKISTLVPALHLNARVEGATLAGAIGVQPNLPFTTPPLGAGERQAFDPDQLACLERLEQSTVDTLEALHSIDGAQHSQVLQAGKAEASRSLTCITDPTLRAEADAYLRALDAVGQLSAPPPDEPVQELTP